MIAFTQDEHNVLAESFEKIGLVIFLAVGRAQDSSVSAEEVIAAYARPPLRRLQPQTPPEHWSEKASGEVVRRTLVSQSEPQSLADPTGFSE